MTRYDLGRVLDKAAAELLDWPADVYETDGVEGGIRLDLASDVFPDADFLHPMAEPRSDDRD